MQIKMVFEKSRKRKSDYHLQLTWEQHEINTVYMAEDNKRREGGIESGKHKTKLHIYIYHYDSQCK